MKTQPSRIVLAGAVLLLALMALLADGAVRRESATFDEIAHIGAGVSYLQKQDMRMNEEHPPLAKVLAAVPLVIRGVRADYSQFSWNLKFMLDIASLCSQHYGDEGGRRISTCSTSMNMFKLGILVPSSLNR